MEAPFERRFWPVSESVYHGRLSISNEGFNSPTGRQFNGLCSSLVERQVEALSVGGSIPLQATIFGELVIMGARWPCKSEVRVRFSYSPPNLGIIVERSNRAYWPSLGWSQTAKEGLLFNIPN